MTTRLLRLCVVKNKRGPLLLPTKMTYVNVNVYFLLSVSLVDSLGCQLSIVGVARGGFPSLSLLGAIVRATMTMSSLDGLTAATRMTTMGNRLSSKSSAN